MSALTSLLVRDGVVPVRKIEEALQRQVIAGGDVETVLLELDAVSENVLAAYRASLLGLPPATRAEVMTVPAEVVGLVPAEVAIEHGLVPLALNGRILEVAVRAPLRPEQEEALGFLLGYEVQPRLATDVRIAAALAHHYGAELSPRFARLLDRLRKRDAGALPQIGARSAPELARHASEIPYKNVEPSPFDRHFEGQTQPLVPLLLEPASGEGPAREVRPRRTTSRGLGAFGRREPVASIPDDDEEVDAGPVVFPSKAEPLPPASTWASEPPPAPTEEPPRSIAPSSLRLVRGPITLAAGERMIKRASSRDQILEIFFSFARQFFDYTAMFVVHDEVADGREASGIGASTEEVLAISIPLDRPSVFAEARRLRAPLVRQLGTNDIEREVLTALRRPATPTALTLPISIRQRVVLLLYGDRNGEDFELGAVMELVRFASRVIEAFEQLIIRKKRVGYHAEADERPSGRGALKQAARSVAETAGRARPSADQRRDSGAWAAGPGKRASQPPADVDSWASVTPDQPRSAVVLPPSETRETVQMVRVQEERAPAPVASPHAPDAPPTRVLGVPRSAPPPPSSFDLDLTGPDLAVAELAVTELVRKAREDEPQLTAGAADEDEEDDYEDDDQGDEEQDEDHAGDDESDEDHDAEDGADDDDDDDDDDVDIEVEIGEGDDDDDLGDLDDLDHVEPPPRFVPPERKAGTYKLRGGPIDVVRGGGLADRSARRGSHDPRREDGDDGVAEEEIVRLRASLRPPPRGLDAETRSVIVDMGEQVHAQVEDLLAASSPATRDALIHGLLYMGEAALPALVQAFPGKLEVNRDTRPVPAGRDVSVVARALIAFGERAVPYVAGLLSSGHPDVRYYAALVASELVHPDLMEAVAERIHDPDPDVRRLACALLPRFAGYRGFDEIRVVTRRTARLRGKDPSRRWQALDALVALRDVEIVEKTIELLKEDDAELVDHAHRALVILTCDDYGRSHRRWRGWFEKRGKQHRIEWLIEGLLHGEESIRTLAGTELERLTQERFGFHPGAPKKDRERAHRDYRRWWSLDGVKRFG